MISWAVRTALVQKLCIELPPFSAFMLAMGGLVLGAEQKVLVKP